MSRTTSILKTTILLILVSLCSCNSLQGDHISDSHGLGVEIVSQTRNRLVLKLWTADGYGNGFAAVVGSPYTKEVTLHESILDGKCRSATVDVQLTGREYGVFLETLRGVAGNLIDDKPKWWTNIVKVYVDHAGVRVADVQFMGDLKPVPIP